VARRGDQGSVTKHPCFRESRMGRRRWTPLSAQYSIESTLVPMQFTRHYPALPRTSIGAGTLAVEREWKHCPQCNSSKAVSHNKGKAQAGKHIFVVAIVNICSTGRCSHAISTVPIALIQRSSHDLQQGTDFYGRCQVSFVPWMPHQTPHDPTATNDKVRRWLAQQRIGAAVGPHRQLRETDRSMTPSSLAVSLSEPRAQTGSSFMPQRTQHGRGHAAQRRHIAHSDSEQPRCVGRC
jgi:hypothetical protein